MRHVIITAGGTVEPIDGVRKITNTSTGKLSLAIYEALAQAVNTLFCHDFFVHYVASETAVLPVPQKSLPMTVYSVSDVKSVEETLNQLMKTYDVSYFIHGMAVSDFTTDYFIAKEQLVEELYEAILHHQQKDRLKDVIASILDNPKHQMNSAQKISSKSELFISLKKTPKLIGKIKQWDPNVFLIGFKLLKDVDEETLIQTASQMASANGCDLVLANDLTKISKDRHEGLLIKQGKVIGRYETKEQIARGIVENMLKETT